MLRTIAGDLAHISVVNVHDSVLAWKNKRNEIIACSNDIVGMANAKLELLWPCKTSTTLSIWGRDGNTADVHAMLRWILIAYTLMWMALCVRLVTAAGVVVEVPWGHTTKIGHSNANESTVLLIFHSRNENAWLTASPPPQLVSVRIYAARLTQKVCLRSRNSFRTDVNVEATTHENKFENKLCVWRQWTSPEVHLTTERNQSHAFLYFPRSTITHERNWTIYRNFNSWLTFMFILFPFSICVSFHTTRALQSVFSRSQKWLARAIFRLFNKLEIRVAEVSTTHS